MHDLRATTAAGPDPETIAAVTRYWHMATRMLVATFAIPVALGILASLIDPSGDGWLTDITFGRVWALLFPFALVVSSVAVLRARDMRRHVSSAEWQQKRGHVVTYGRAACFGTFVAHDGDIPIIFRSLMRTHHKLATAALNGEILVATTSKHRRMLAPLDRSFVVPGLAIRRRSHQTLARDTAQGIEEWTHSREGQRVLHSGPEYAAALESEDGSYLRLAIFRYEFDDGDNWHDRNWLRVRATVSAADSRWGFEDPCLLTTEARDLSNWLAQAATPSAPPPPLSFTEPNLAFRIVGASTDTRTIEVSFAQEARPPAARETGDHDTVAIDLVVKCDALRRAAERLRGQLEEFPER